MRNEKTSSYPPLQIPDDYGSVVELWDHSGPGVHRGRSDTLEEITKKQSRDLDLFLVAEHRGKTVGVVMGDMMVGEHCVINWQLMKNIASNGLGKL